MLEHYTCNNIDFFLLNYGISKYMGKNGVFFPETLVSVQISKGSKAVFDFF